MRDCNDIKENDENCSLFIANTVASLQQWLPNFQSRTALSKLKSLYATTFFHWWDSLSKTPDNTTNNTEHKYIVTLRPFTLFLLIICIYFCVCVHIFNGQNRGLSSLQSLDMSINAQISSAVILVVSSD